MQTSSHTYLIPGSILIAGLLIAGAVYMGNRSSDTTPTVPGDQGQVADAPDIDKVSLDGEPYVGDPNAPVTIAYWFDYQCPFCKQAETTALSAIMDEYVKAGKVRIVFKDFEFLGPDSTAAALASSAVWEAAPEKFYEWHQAMFEKQDAENSGWGSKADILALTKTIPGIDAAKVEELMTLKADEYQKEIDQDQAEGVQFGIQGTPGFIIGKQIIGGAQPYAQFKAAIDTVLNS